MQPRVLFCLKWREQPYGCGYGWGGENGGLPLSSGLYNSARLVAEMLRAAGYAADVVHVVDGNAIHCEIVKFDADIVVIEAFWCPPYKFDDLHRACPNVQFIVRNHSETAFLAGEGSAFGWSYEYLTKPNVVLAPNSVRMLADTRTLMRAAHPEWTRRELERRVFLLPNFYDMSQPANPRKGDDGYLDVGCFGAIRPLKNVLTQAVAAIHLARKIGRPLHFNINGGRVEMTGAPILKNLQAIFDNTPDAELWTHAWLPYDDFRGLIAKMDLVTQATLSETFCIVAADAVSQGVPAVMSAEIPWSSDESRADPTRSESIAKSMLAAWRRGAPAYGDIMGLRAYNATSRRIWLDYLT